MEKFEAKFKGMTANGEQNQAGIGVKIETDDLLAMDELLTGAQLQVVLSVSPAKNKDTDGQQTIPGTSEAAKVEATADCKSFSRKPGKPGTVDFKLLFNDSAVDLKELVKLTGKAGQATIERIGDSTGDEGE